MASQQQPPAKKLPLYLHFASSATAACTAEAISLPLDTAKVRLQLQSRAPPGTLAKYRGVVGTLQTVIQEEGASALWKGLEPGLHRQVVYGGLRIGLYEPVRDLIVGKNHKGDVPLLTKIAAALVTSTAAITVASPTDLVKVRMQAEGRLPPGVPRKYPSAFKAYNIVIRQEGVRALWTGLGPNIARNAIVSASALASYDQVKQTLLKSGLFEENVLCHLVSGLGAGFCSVVFGSPPDVVKSRMMGAAPGTYSGVLDAFAKTFVQDGPLAFYKGFTFNFARLGSWNVVMFLTLEEIKALLGVPRSKGGAPG